MTRSVRTAVAAMAAAITFSSFAGSYDAILKAAIEGDNATVISLLQRGMDANTSDMEGNTLLMFAARGGNQQLLDILLKNNASYRKINRFGDDALLLAALNGHLNCVRSLVNAGAPVNREHSGWTPLLYAAFAGHTDIVAYLLEREANIDAQSANGSTPLMLAARNGHRQTVELLLKNKADVDVENDMGLTALKMAIAGNNTEIVQLLKAAGAVR